MTKGEKNIIISIMGLAIMGALFSPWLVHAYQNQPNDNPPPKPQKKTAQTAQRGSKGKQQMTFKPGDSVQEGQLPSGYNHSAAYSCSSNWDVAITGNYLYWAWNQSTLQFGTSVTGAINPTEDSTETNTALFQTPGYTSGFQVGVGFGMRSVDNWNLYSEYTWYKNSDTQTFSGTTTSPIVLASEEFRLDQLFGGNDLTGDFSSNVRLGFQALDFLAQRPFYFGRKLTANFSMGLKALWVSQNFSRSSSSVVSTSGNSYSNYDYNLGQTSWSLGPKFGFDTNWLLCYGIKIMGNIAQSALYTSFNTASTANLTFVNGVTYSRSQTGLQNYGTISPVTETFLGLGWGSYFCDRAFHLDFSIGYDFDIYWNYNMVNAANTQSQGNMYLQGMNIQLRFDF